MLDSRWKPRHEKPDASQGHIVPRGILTGNSHSI
jgi:hypothetical protein